LSDGNGASELKAATMTRFRTDRTTGGSTLWWGFEK